MATRTNANQGSRQISSSPPSIINIILTSAFSLIFLVGGVYIGYLFYHTVRSVVATAELPTLPYLDMPLPVIGSNVKERGGDAGPIGSTGVLLPSYEKNERVNILLLGVDKRPNEQYSRTDTMILVSVDPKDKTASMLSIPRDLWVSIPGYAENRINVAHYLGDKDGYPGGGPALAMKTVQYNLGVPVHFYARVDFNGFRKIIDTLGGIDVDVAQDINDQTYPDDNFGYDPLVIPAGVQHMDGDLALKYARSRHGNSDFSRATRQQQVLLAIRQRALSLNIVSKVPELYNTMADTIQTDLQLVDILELAKIADKINDSSIKTSVIDNNLTVDYTTDTGARVLLPVREKIRGVVQELFNTDNPGTPSEKQIDAVAQAAQQAQQQANRQQELLSKLSEEKASIVIQNGTKETELDSSTASYLKSMGFNVIQFGPADMPDYPKTVLVDYSGKQYTMESLASIFHVSEDNIRHSSNLRSDIDIRVIIGADFKMPNAQAISAR